MFDNGGIGLSANQVGYDCSVFVMKGQNKEQSMFIANPEILEVSEDKVLMEEGCLTPVVRVSLHPFQDLVGFVQDGKMKQVRLKN